jgi:hypothetical protein
MRLLNRPNRKLYKLFVGMSIWFLICILITTSIQLVRLMNTTSMDTTSMDTTSMDTSIHNTSIMDMDLESSFDVLKKNTDHHSIGGIDAIADIAALEPKEQAYRLALQRFQARSLSSGTITNSNFALSRTTNLKLLLLLKNPRDNLNQNQNPPRSPRTRSFLLNIIRIPKAGSSSLSMMARALAGCKPDGYPCCKFPGSPKGSCPKRNLVCPVIRGCTGHVPNFQGDEPAITSLRHPVERLISAFFYYPPHRPSPRTDFAWPTFESYVAQPKYVNVVTKMLNGAFAYDNYTPSLHSLNRAKGRLCQLAWFSIAEWPIPSSLMLYESAPFRNLQPHPLIFGLPITMKDDDDRTVSRSGSANQNNNKNDNQRNNTDGFRVNSNSNYVLWKERWESKAAEWIETYNQQDLQLYEFGRGLFAARWRASDLSHKSLSSFASDDEMRSYTGSVQDYCPSY